MLVGYGGFGFTSRKWGLTLDTINSLEVVLANGTIVTASQSTYPDLFWALRGSSGSFGVVTKVNARTFEAPSSATVFQYVWNFTPEEAAAALGQFQSHALSSGLPQEYGAEITIGPWGSPGTIYVTLTGGWYAPADQLQTVLKPLLDKIPQKPSVKLTSGSYLDSVKYLSDTGSLDISKAETHDTFYARSLMVPQDVGLSDSARLSFFQYLSKNTNSTTDWFIQVELYGGTNSAINQVAADATSFGHRDSLFTIQFYTSAKGGVPPFPQDGFTLVDGMVDSIVKNSPSGESFGAYANYIESHPENWQSIYYGSNYPKLQAIKRQYDPKNILRFPTSIEL